MCHQRRAFDHEDMCGVRRIPLHGQGGCAEAPGRPRRRSQAAQSPRTSGAVVVQGLSTCPGPPGQLSALRVFHSKAVLYGVFVLARRALNQKRRFPARAVHPKRAAADPQVCFPLLRLLFSYYAEGCMARCMRGHIMKYFRSAGEWPGPASRRLSGALAPQPARPTARHDERYGLEY